MASTIKKSGKRSRNGAATAKQPSEVLTLSEAAAYLRVPAAEVLALAERRELPGRQIGGEWRFLKDTVQDWLRSPPRPTGKEAFLALAGAWRDDPTVAEMVCKALQRRGRALPERVE